MPDHLFIVLSAIESNEVEGTFIGIMITSSTEHYDDFSFDLRDEMFERPLQKKESHVRMHLIALWLNREIIGNRVNRMKEFYFRQLMASVGDLVFQYRFAPISSK